MALAGLEAQHTLRLCSRGVSAPESRAQPALTDLESRTLHCFMVSWLRAAFYSTEGVLVAQVVPVISHQEHLSSDHQV